MNRPIEGMVVRRAADRAWVGTERGLMECLLRRGISRLAGRLAVGDRVTIQEATRGAMAIQEILPRRSFLPRPHVANLDQLVLVTAFQAPPLHCTLLDRLGVVSRAIHLSALLVFNKLDLARREDRAIPEKYRRIGFDVLETSIKTKEGIENLENRLAGKLSVFLGVSGVGKTSLLKALDPSIRRPVKGLSGEAARGRHTTSRSEIFFLRGNPDLAVADTPGFDWFRLLPNSLSGILLGFPEFLPFVSHCAFQDCAHWDEPVCAVRRAVEAGTIWNSRYENYRLFVEELRSRKPVWERKRTS